MYTVCSRNSLKTRSGRVALQDITGRRHVSAAHIGDKLYIACTNQEPDKV